MVMLKYYDIEKRTFGVNTDADGNLLSCFHGKSAPHESGGLFSSQKII